MGFWFNGGNRSTVTINANNDGTFSLAEGSVDIGGTRTSIAMQAAEILGLPAEAIRPVVADTESVGYNDSTAGSRTTYASGAAAAAAAQTVLDEFKVRAAKIWDIPEDQVLAGKGNFSSSSDPSLKLSIKDVAKALARTGGPVSASATTNMQGGFAGLATHIVDVEVDAETGKVDVIRYTAVQDAGKAIHPAYVEGQMEGGAVQGIGWALSEEYYMSENGAMENATLLDYRMPTTLDVPKIETIIVEVPNPNHPFGVRGVGETPIVPTLAAVANAVHDALGIRFPKTPIKPSRVLDALSQTTKSG
jgi:CO/xanthine dehydrogenase Mo-binding subunit